LSAYFEKEEWDRLTAEGQHKELDGILEGWKWETLNIDSWWSDEI
jgi:hypothetical protein